ncbi:hypothetical protein [Aquimarina rhabdastrellae]
MAITKRAVNIEKTARKNYVLKAKNITNLAETIKIEAGDGEVKLNSKAKINIKGDGGS